MNNFLGNKQDIIKYLNARMTGNDIQKSIEYFNQLEVNYILFLILII